MAIELHASKDGTITMSSIDPKTGAFAILSGFKVEGFEEPEEAAAFAENWNATNATAPVEHVTSNSFFSPEDEAAYASSWNIAEDIIEAAEEQGEDTTTLAFHASLMDYEEGAYTYHRRHMSTLRTLRSLMARDAEGEIDLSSQDIADLTTCGMLNF